jgi:hypothetical protein
MLCFSSQWMHNEWYAWGSTYREILVFVGDLLVINCVGYWLMQSAGKVDIWNYSQIKHEVTTQPFVRRQYWTYPADALVHVASSVKFTFTSSYWNLFSPLSVFGTREYDRLIWKLECGCLRRQGVINTWKVYSDGVLCILQAHFYNFLSLALIGTCYI